MEWKEYLKFTRFCKWRLTHRLWSQIFQHKQEMITSKCFDQDVKTERFEKKNTVNMEHSDDACVSWKGIVSFCQYIFLHDLTWAPHHLSLMDVVRNATQLESTETKNDDFSEELHHDMQTLIFLLLFVHINFLNRYRQGLFDNKNKSSWQ